MNMKWVMKNARKQAHPNPTSVPGYKSGLAIETEEAIKQLGVPYDTEKPVFDLEFANGETHTFTPDFLLKVSADVIGRQMLVECHGSQYFDKAFLNKLKTFMQSQHHKNYFLVVVTNHAFLSYVRANMDSLKLSEKDISDRFILIGTKDMSDTRGERIAALSKTLKMQIRRGETFSSFWALLERDGAGTTSSTSSSLQNSSARL